MKSDIKQISFSMSIGIVLMLVCLVFFLRNESSIYSINASFRTLLTMGAISRRAIDEHGIPVSSNPRTGEYVSPFYVVHYGLIYSNGHRPKSMDGSEISIWWQDPSLEYWGDGYSSSTNEYFMNTVEWLKENANTYMGHKHLVYQFDWSYPKAPYEKLRAPWWSGLTDAYALLVLARAHQVYGDEEAILLADELYESVTASILKGGSIVENHGCVWIEEYVEPRWNSVESSRVLNGMIYSTIALDAYARYRGLDTLYVDDLYDCIARNLHRYDVSGWSKYDLYGTFSNIKYHQVHIMLLRWLHEKTGRREFDFYANKWADNAWFYTGKAIWNKETNIAVLHGAVTFFFIVIVFPWVSVYLFKRFARNWNGKRAR